MKLLSASTFTLGIFAALCTRAVAADMNARVKSVDPGAHTITVVEGHKDYVFTTTDKTEFVNAKGDVVAKGLEGPAQEVRAGVLVPGTRLSIHFDQQGDQRLVSLVKLRDLK